MDWKLDILPIAQRQLLSNLNETPKDFILYGGTAIALQLGHRESIDFDFFSSSPFDPFQLYKSIPYLKDADIFQSEPNVLSCTVKNEHGIIKMSYFGDLSTMNQVSKPFIMEGVDIRIASLIDLFGTKCKVILQRAEKKDYIDIEAIIRLTEYKIEDGLSAALSIYGSHAYDGILSLRSLSSFNDGNLPELNENVKTQLQTEVKNVDFNQIKPITPTTKLGNNDD